DDARSEIIVDKNGNPYVASCTRSTNFPLVVASQAANAGSQDAVFFKMNSNLTGLIWSTYFGGAGDDAGYVLALDTAQTHLFVSGGTTSQGLPTAPNVWQPAYGGGLADGYIGKYL